MIQGKRNNLWVHGFPDNIPTVKLRQWGLALTGEQKYDVLITTTFPISFNEIFQAIPILQGTGKNEGGRGSDCLYSISNNNLIFWHGSDEMGNTGIRYIAIGK